MTKRTQRGKVLTYCLALLILLPAATWAQGVTQAQLTTLVPDEQELQGFTRTRPAGEIPMSETFSQAEHKWYHPVSPAQRTEDKIILNADVAAWRDGALTLPGRNGKINGVIRTLYSANQLYRLELRAFVYDTADAAQEAVTMERHSSRTWTSGTFYNDTPIGDESWVLPDGGLTSFNTIIVRTGRMVTMIIGSASRVSGRTRPAFPQRAIEAVAYEVLLQAARQTTLTGISAQTVRLAINGKPVSGSPSRVGQQVYVPVVEFAKAMGLQSQWNEKTGVLTLSGPKQQTITVTTTSTKARVGQTSVALKIPVLKEANQPVMALDDLLRLVKGKVTSRKGNVVEVKA